MGRKDDIPAAAAGGDEFKDEHAPAGIPEFFEDGGDDTPIPTGTHRLRVTSFVAQLNKEKTALARVKVEAVRADGQPGVAGEMYSLGNEVGIRSWKEFATQIGARARGAKGIPTRAELYVGKEFDAYVDEYDEFLKGSRIKRVVKVS